MGHEREFRKNSSKEAALPGSRIRRNVGRVLKGGGFKK
jgi:hypothetical protein